MHNGRNTRFLNQCRQYLPNATAFDCNWMLLNLRKFGDLSSVVVTKRRRDNHDLAYQLRKAALRLRVSQHLNQTDRKALASYLWEKGIRQIQVELHVFAAESKAKHVSVRRAYESELIRSRQPRFNVRP